MMANVDDTIYLNQGIYKQSNITIEKDLTIEGKESPEKVIIDGESKNGIIKSHSPIKLTIRNITFINGFNIGNGGAIYFNGVGQLTIENCNFINNKITDKDGEGQGGAVFTTGDAKSHMQLTIKNCKFMNNTASTDDGAANTRFTNANIDNCIFDHNYAVRDGGAISTRGASNLIIKNSAFMNNIAEEWGGAINNWISKFEFDRCTFINNTAKTEGGAITTCGSKTIVTNSYIINNTALDVGGAINIHKDADNLFVSLNNNEIYGNTAPQGSAVYIIHEITGDFNFEENYWGNVNPNLANWNEVFDVNGVCDNPKTWLELAPTTILASDLNRGYNSPYDFIATFLDKFGRPLKYTQVSFKVNNNNYNVITDSNGVAKLVLKLDVGTYSITAVNIDGTEVIKTVNILKRITGNSNLNKDYHAGTYKVRIVGDDGNYVKSGQIVTFKIGKKIYNVKTDANGYTSLAIKQTPGKYQITATYNGNTVKNTIKVKRILKASNISKKKAKKIKYTATLKTSAGKAIKNKKITFKIKGKTYRAKTNKKGKATITLKKLKVGKYKITIKYVNDSIKRTIKIKK